ncbi:MAG: vWA domain-containing protein [Myxococcota bacterium]
MELLQPLGLIALISVPPIVALYFLRQRRPPRKVGSLMLWRLARNRVYRGRPWEKFRPSLLLLLQVLAAVLVALALARPACITSGLKVERMVLILDASGSMASTDVEPNRWRVAVARARETVETAPSGSEIALLRAGLVTRVVEPFTQDRTRLLNRLDQLDAQGPDATSATLSEALLLGLQLQSTRGDGDPGQLVLFSDGAFDASTLPAAGDRLTWVGVGERSDNLAITTFELRQAAQQRFGTAAIVTVTNTGQTALEAHLDVQLDGRTLEAHRVSLAPETARTFSIPVSTDEGRLVATLEAIRDPSGGDARDMLASDNKAYAVIAPPRPIRVLLVGTNPMLERALAVNTRLELERIEPQDFVAGAEYDVMVFENNFPATLPQGRFLAIAPPMDNPLIDYASEPVDTPSVATWDRGHPALFHVDLAQIRFAQASPATPAPQLVPLAEFDGTTGPLVLAGQTPSWRGLVWTTGLLDSDFMLRIGFPVFLYNAIGWLAPGAERAPGRTVRAGQPLRIPAQPGSRIAIETPYSEPVQQVAAPGAEGVHRFTATTQPGFYVARLSSTTPPIEVGFGVSMIQVQESSIAPASSLNLARGGTMVVQQETRHVREWLSWLLVGLLGLLAVEWWVFLRQRPR